MREYKNAEAARRALEDRIRAKAAADGSDINSVRRKLAFDILLERISANGIFILKGGYAMELKNLNQALKARPTKDMDFVHRLKSATDNVELSIRMTLEELADLKPEQSPSKYFDFEFGRATLELDIGGYRYPVTAKMESRRFEAFLIDVTHEDFLDLAKTEKVKTKTLNELTGANSEATTILSTQKFSEKLHGFTKPRDSENSRVKDLVDLIIIITQHNIDEKECAISLNEIFDHRQTHDIPTRLIPPPDSWRDEYHAMANSCHLTENTIEEAMDTLTEFYQRVMKYF